MVGAGAAGLAAAWTLSRAGIPVEVFEAGAGPGGRMRSETFEGAHIEVGAQFLATHQTETLRISRETGAGGLLRRAPGRDALWRNGRAHPIQYGSVPSMVTSGALPAGLKFRMASRYVPFLHRHAAHLDPSDVRPAAGAGFDDASIAEWGREHLGTDFVELLARPQTAAYYGSEPERTSAALYHSLAAAALDLGLVSIAGGTGALARRWAAALTDSGAVVHLEAPVEAVRRGGDGVVLAVSEEERSFHACVVAVPPAPAARLLAGTEAAAALEAIDSAPSSLLAVALDRPFRPGWFGLGLPRDAPGGRTIAVLAAADGRSAEADAAAARIALIFPAPGAVSGDAGADPRSAFDLLWPLARALLGGGSGPQAERGRLYGEPQGHSLFPPGFAVRLRALAEAPKPAEIVLAGDYRVAPSVEGAVRSGIEAAREVTEVLRRGVPDS